MAIFHIVDEQPVPVLRDLADRVVNALGDCAVVLSSRLNGKSHAVAKVSSSVLKSITAKELIDALTSVTGGGAVVEIIWRGRDQRTKA